MLKEILLLNYIIRNFKREKKTLLHGDYAIFETKPPNFRGNHGYS
jgi:hypothetical protein